MIQTIRDYSYLSKKNDEADRLSSKVGRSVDVYWSRENENFMVTLRNRIDIIIEFKKNEPINPHAVRKALYNLDRGGILNLRSDFNLGAIAAQARKDKANEEFDKEMRHHLRDADQYESHGKRSFTMPGEQT